MALVEIEPVSYADARFWLEAATDPDDDTTVDLLYRSEDLARKAATDLIDKFQWVQISEWGEWQLQNGKTQCGWIIFWWTEACGYNGVPAAESGNIGIPEGKARPRKDTAAQRPDDE